MLKIGSRQSYRVNQKVPVWYSEFGMTPVQWDNLPDYSSICILVNRIHVTLTIRGRGEICPFVSVNPGSLDVSNKSRCVPCLHCNPRRSGISARKRETLLACNQTSVNKSVRQVEFRHFDRLKCVKRERGPSICLISSERPREVGFKGHAFLHTQSSAIAPYISQAQLAVQQ